MDMRAPSPVLLPFRDGGLLPNRAGCPHPGLSYPTLRGRQGALGFRGVARHPLWPERCLDALCLW